MYIDKKVYINHSISRYELSLLKRILKGITEQYVGLEQRTDVKYVIYTHIGDKKTENNNFIESFEFDIKGFSDFVSIDVYVFINNNDPIRINLKKTNIQSVDINNSEKIYYEFIKGESKNLIVCFDYSRNTEKTHLHNEFLKKINPKTSDSILIISNNFGYWGTSSCFDSSGCLIIPSVTELINKIYNQFDLDKISFIGGSQGATACLIYSSFFLDTYQVHAASPVPLEFKGQLQHLKNKIKPVDLQFVNSMLEYALNSKKINFYTSEADHYKCYVSQLHSKSLPESSLRVCKDEQIQHAGVLKYFIKDIYNSFSPPFHKDAAG
jgi:hypothetical protein